MSREYEWAKGWSFGPVPSVSHFGKPEPEDHMTITRSRVAALAATSALFVTLAACGGSDAATETSVETTVAEATETTVAHSGELPHWTYEGEEGPENWGALTPEYAACADGSAQTPIDVVGAVEADLADPEFDYAALSATVINNGHTIQANASDGNTVIVDGAVSPLTQIHFHSPSEHTIDGVSAVAEVHFVHVNDDSVITVVGVMIAEGAVANAAWQPYVDALTTPEGVETPVELDWSAMLPAAHTSYRYTGSLTTPPCTEGVNWLLMSEPVSLSAEQIAAFAAAYEGNNRPVQPLNGRELELDSTIG
jgi:carbonic anhydrase